MQGPALVWFREDLRLADNPALSAAAASGRPVLCLYVLEGESPESRPLGAASRWWLHHSLETLIAALGAIGLTLVLMRGPAQEAIAALVRETQAGAVFWNRRYGPERAIDADIKAALLAVGVKAHSFGARLLFEPGELTTRSGGSFKIFTAYWKAALARGAGRAPLGAPVAARPFAAPAHLTRRVALADLKLRPERPDWAGGLRATWRPGEAAARERLAAFLEGGLRAYARERDRPDREATSRLSPHLRFGEISPRQILHAARFALESGAGSFSQADFDKLRAELTWRDFSHQILFDEPALARRSLDPRFDAFPWRHDPEGLAAWRAGRTGYPLVDAGMRQLWQTGYLHNRVRMVAASFLVKHLLIDWREGEDWFWDTLVDADPANNAASWQWVAGSGIDAAPYFRVFNPVLQGKRYDPEGDYVRRFVPELARLPAAFVQEPWRAPAPVLEEAGLRLGRDYPAPVVGHEEARRRALAAYDAMRGSAG